ncbi:c-type cytochrome [Akkermansiaceae bacterium]|mgnify:FL=1|jgi:putative heme-binding domain-containing protein|nr:c-type cytochrome [bacterium]MDA7532375.1 c-type cytochrome [Akkermansiaceae bacterium]MDC0281375.1 c-type cytochrome [Akkermansiaceae bacterium]MDC0285116.1 c-type cytochrome [Akkermansiaceae bacterium]MDC0567590.1 c-type cytochrome [Akkermansiaceae bacterium]
MKHYLIHLTILSLLCPKAFAADPMWIWKAGTIASEEANFKTTLTLKAKPAKAPLIITCDNSFKLSINGKKVTASKNWETPVRMDVAKFLQAGKNYVLVEADNEGSMAGFIMSLKAGKQKLVTNKSWMAQSHEGEWHQAVELKKYGAEPWGNVFNQAAGPGQIAKATNSPKSIPVTTLPGFKAEKIYDVNKASQGSWVGMTVDPKGRLITTDQYGGIYRVTLNPKVSVERLKVNVSGGHGALYAFDSLYIMVGEGKRGLYRLRDTNGDDQYDKEEYLIPLKAGGEHGSHSLVLSPDKKSIYMVGGNNTDMPPSVTSYRMAKAWKEDHILPRMPDGRGHNNGRMAPGGFIMKVSPDGKTQEMICHGFRNEFDAAFNLDGELFAFDADMEYDIGAPWYRPTRVNHVVSGVDWGWRHGTGKWPNYYTDTLPATIDIGPGSPTGVSNGLGARFPAKYQKAIYINDWTYGTMYAIHLEQDGASYKATKEEFVSGKPLPLTDVTIHPDGDMYFMVGGRRTTSALYKLTYVGDESTARVKAGAVDTDLTLRRKIETLHENGVGEEAIAKALPYLKHQDRFIRYAARVALEKQPATKWQQHLTKEKSPWGVIELSTALARMGTKDQQPKILAALNQLDFKNMEAKQFLAALRAYQLAFTRLDKPSSGDAASVIGALNGLYPHEDNFVNRELSQILLYLNAPGAVSKTVQLVLNATDIQEKILDDKVLQRNDNYAKAAQRTEQFRPNVQQFALAFSLRSIKEGWSAADHASYFSWFPRAKTWQGGNSYGAFIENSRKQALANVTNEGARKKYEAASAKSMMPARAIQTPKGPGRSWTVQSAVSAVEGNMKGRNFARGENLFHATACASCHRFAGEGMGIGPDLTGSANRYALRDMMENIVEPSKVISDQYISTGFAMKDGSTVIGRIAKEKDGMLHLMTNPFSADSNVQIKAADVKSRKPHEVSHMPPSLINGLNSDELSDLIAYIFSAGDKDHHYFSGGKD